MQMYYPVLHVILTFRPKPKSFGAKAKGFKYVRMDNFARTLHPPPIKDWNLLLKRNNI